MNIIDILLERSQKRKTLKRTIDLGNMTSITFKTDEDRQYHLEVGEMNSNILSAGSPGRVRKIADYLKGSEIVEGDRGMTVVHGEFEGISVSAFPTGMGPSSASVVIPEAIEAAGDRLTLLRLGTAGSLQPDVNVGDIVVAEGAIRDEGTTSAVVGPEFPSIADPVMIPLILGAAERKGYSLGEDLWSGIIHVKDDLYFKENPKVSPERDRLKRKMDSYREMGALSSSMEFSVYTILRDYYQGEIKESITVGALLGIIGEIEERIEVDGEVKKSLEEDLIEIGLDVLLLTERLRKGEGTDLEFEDILREHLLS